jgi:hypothetical protein
MPNPKVTKAERLVNEQMLAMLEWRGFGPNRYAQIWLMSC